MKRALPLLLFSLGMAPAFAADIPGGGISADNIASIKLHAQFGFEKVAHYRETIYKFDQWLDVVYMEKLL